MANPGFFFGGLVKGQESAEAEEFRRDQLASLDAFRGRSLDLQEQGLGLQERRLAEDVRLRERGLSIQEKGLGIRERAAEHAANRQLAADFDALIDEDVKVATEFAMAAAEKGWTAEKIDAGIEEILGGVPALVEKFNSVSPIQTSMKQIANRINAVRQTAITAAEQARIDAGAEVAGSLARREALTDAGVSERVAADVSGLAEPESEVTNFAMPNGSVRAVFKDNRADMERAIAEGGREVGLQVQAQGLEGITTAPDEDAVLEVRARLDNLRSGAAELRNSLEAFKKTPEAAGLVGAGIQTIGGFLQQLPVVGGAASEVMAAAGIKPEEVAAVRTQAELVVSDMLTFITNETTRFTDEERNRTRTALRQLKLDASFPQIMASGQVVEWALQRQIVRDVDKLRTAAGLSIDDLRTPKGVNELGDILLKNNFTRDEAVDAIMLVRQRLGVN